MPSITSANVAQAIVKLVAADALPALMSNLVMGNIVNRSYEPLLASAGDTVNVPLPPTMVANNILEGGSVVTQNPNLGNAPIVLDKHAESTFIIPDVTKVLAVPDLLKLYMQPALIAMAEKIETDLLSLYPELTQLTPLGAANTAVTEAVVSAAETAFFDAKVPNSEPKFCVWSSSAYDNIRNIPRFSEVQKIGAPGALALIEGEIGRLKGMYHLRSQNVIKTGTNTHNIAIARDALALVMRRLPQPLPGTGAIAEYAELGNFGFRVVMSYAPNTLSQQFTIDALYGVAVLRNGFGMQINS